MCVSVCMYICVPGVSVCMCMGVYMSVYGCMYVYEQK